MHSLWRRSALLISLALGLLVIRPVHAGPERPRVDPVVTFPQPVEFYQNTSFTIEDNVGYVPSKDRDKLWSFSTATGELLDEDGLTLPDPATASDGYLFPNDRLAIPGWFPNQGILVADVSDPSDLAVTGVITFPHTTNIQGQNIAIDEDNVGYVAGFPDDHLYSFNVNTLMHEDPDGLSLPGNPDRIARAGDLLAMVDTANGQIMVADVSDPTDLKLAGTIDLPGSNVFGSDDNIVFADDGRTGFVSSNGRVLYSFDVVQRTLLDPDGIAFGESGLGTDVAIHDRTVACLSSEGLSFIDASNASDMELISDADFGGDVLIQGAATVAFSATGKKAAAPTIVPDDLVYAFDVSSGRRIAHPVPVGESPNFLTVYQPNNQVAVISTREETIHLIEGLLGYVNYMPMVVSMHQQP